MFSWLNFEELLIHNPIELINPSKDTISVAMSQKQYIEFFSNKYTYNGLYYDENMDFCLFYYADPLQSYKEGDVYAQGYIDVEMKIYRVKWLCNVSISRASGLLQTTDGTQGVAQEDGKYTHTAWAYSADGTDRFSTIYPRFNLLDGTSRQVVQATSWNMKVADIKYDKSLGATLCASVMINNADHASELLRGSAKIFIQILDKSGNILKSIWGNDINYNANGLSQCSISIDDNTASIQVFIFTNSMVQNAFYSCLKVEDGSNATPYMPSSSEVTTADGPSYIGQYTDYTLEDSTNPSSYTWREIQDDKWNVTKTEMVVNNKNKTITTVLTGALAKCTKDKDITGWQNSQPNANYNYRQPQYSLDIGADDFIISGYGLRGLKNG